MIIDQLGVNNFQNEDFQIHREDGMPDYLFVLFKSPAEVFAEGKYEDVDAGVCICFDKYKIQSYHPKPGISFLHDYLHFDLESDYERMLFSDFPLGVPFPVSLPRLISESLSDICREQLRAASANRREIMSHYGIIFLCRLKDEVDHGTLDREKRENFRILYDLRTEIYREPQTDWSIDSICRRLGISRSYFQHLYREFFSVSPMQDVIAARIDVAKNLLVNSNLRISEVAERCGYRTLTHFIHQFEKYVGVTPGRYGR